MLHDTQWPWVLPGRELLPTSAAASANDYTHLHSSFTMRTKNLKNGHTLAPTREPKSPRTEGNNPNKGNRF